MRGNLGWTKEKIEQARDRAGMAAMVDIDTFLSALDEIEHLTAELDDLRDDDDIEDPPVWTEEQSQAFFALMESFPVDPEVTLWNEFHERIGEMSMEEVKDAKRKLDTYDAQTAQLAAAQARVEQLEAFIAEDPRTQQIEDMAIERHHAQAREARLRTVTDKALRTLELVEFGDYQNGPFGTCPVCGYSKRHGHGGKCAMEQSLAESRAALAEKP